ncbi:snake venom 5'-nucleotidase [Rhipicephalus microplus]|uniref:snake venom 5'-nucleotidase n=1 Tax=Rhipicephalus microplus TaxID=6941 RepID=UPI001887178B|nr:snake venom 5'-nucleotidase-like isoform X1 [Rhipicephalus microplus]XP_037284245.1 snake venom 5'-nucleotidase-like isoform X1 [Rhipicephalus microplus]XP_037284246.1 snake venom 5'-nucleotidase-like isoform X1 [Rhipicephalus microplus]XP_037284248.1 snake venom 5'-nucleotidase-like isoform X1 [Rhipicephalus microplus]
MPEEGEVVTVLHFNDCYNVEEQHGEPVGGATRFCTALKSFASLNPLILFSGDVLAPSIMSTFTKGEQMVPVLNCCKVDCAVYGNHDFDFGVDNLTEFAKQTKFPWLMSNVVDNETGKLLADGEEFQILERSGKKIGLIGLVEEEWLATLATIDPEDVEYKDFVTEGRRLARFLKQKKGVDYVIALTHMRTPNDCHLAANVDEVDLILGGHDHVYEIKKVNGKNIVKSGTDFRQFSHITLTFTASGVTVDITEVNVTSDFAEDPELRELLSKYKDVVQGKMDEVIGHFAVDLDGRFSSIRTSETNLGNFICDVMLSATHSDLAILNSGTLRSDRIHRKGAFTMRDLVTVLPMMDSLIVLSATGDQILQALENGVSQYPKLEGRFPQVSGVSFAFDPKKPPGQRIDPQFVRIGDEPLDKNQKYRLVTKNYLAQGKDGYDVFKECEVLLRDDESPELCTAVQNHFQAVRILTGVAHPRTHHRQSLVCLSRRHSLVRTCEDVTMKPPLKRGLSLDASARRGLFRQRQTSLEDVEHETCKMEPKVENRIVIFTEEQVVKKFWEDSDLHPLCLVEEVIEEEPSTGSFEKN